MSQFAPRRVVGTSLFACALVPVSVGTAQGQQTDPYEDRVTVTATGSEVAVDSVPLVVTVLGRQEIDDTQEESVADLLRRVPGLQVFRTGDEGSPTSLFVRGTESDQTLALFDGVRLNSPYFAGYDWSQLSLAGVEQVEVARGPYSAIWGSDAIGGAVNVISRRSDAGVAFSAQAEAGDDDWQRLQGTLNGGTERFDAMVSLFDRQGEDNDLDNSDFSNSQLLGKAGLRFGTDAQHRVGVLWQDLESDIGIPFSNPLNPTPNRRQGAEQEMFALPVQLQPTESWSVQLTPSVIERTLRFRDPDDGFGFVASDTAAETSQARLISRHAVADGRHDVSWGAEWREDEVDASSNFGVDLAGDTTTVSGVFVQDVWQANERLTVVAGARFDDADEFGSEVSPRLSLGWLLGDGVQLRASYGEAFRQPSVGELFFPFSGNRELDPERSSSAEVGLVVGRGAQRLEIAAFATDTDDLIDFDFATFAFANVEEATIRGAEVSWRVRATQSLTSTAQATWLDTEDQDGLQLLRRPEWSASWTLGGALTRKLRGDLTTLYVGERFDVDAISFARKEVDDYVTAHLALSYRLFGDFELTARVMNLADEDYQEVDGYPAPGRRFVGGVRWGF